MIKNTKQFLFDHDGFEDFDDFNECSKNRTGKIVILYFIDENKNNFINYFIKEYNQFCLPLFIIVGTETKNNQLKEEINKSLKDLGNNKRIIDKNIFKFSNINENIENNIIDININLIECSAYYNDIEDEFKYQKQFLDEKLFEKVNKNIYKNCSTLNILICGKAGAGKSTFINGILKSSICKNRKGSEFRQRINKYFHRTLPITFYITPGMTTGYKLDSIIKLIEKNFEFETFQNKIHAVFYIINGREPRFFYDLEIKMLELILVKMKVPLYLLVTQFQTRKDFEECKNIIIKNYSDVINKIDQLIDNQYKRENIEKNIFCINMIGNHHSQTDKLFEKMFQDFTKYIIPQEINKNNLEEITKNNYFISNLKNPQDIIPHPVKSCQYIYLKYRLFSR